jgi:hypothetical protein
MKSRIAISALFTLIAAWTVASHANDFQKLKGFWACKVSSAAQVWDRATCSGSAATVKTSLSSRAQHLQRAVLNLIDHQGE